VLSGKKGGNPKKKKEQRDGFLRGNSESQPEKVMRRWTLGTGKKGRGLLEKGEPIWQKKVHGKQKKGGKNAKKKRANPMLWTSEKKKEEPGPKEKEANLQKKVMRQREILVMKRGGLEKGVEVSYGSPEQWGVNRVCELKGPAAHGGKKKGGGHGGKKKKQRPSRMTFQVKTEGKKKGKRPLKKFGQ